jgi:hypothetical protein
MVAYSVIQTAGNPNNGSDATAEGFGEKADVLEISA